MTSTPLCNVILVRLSQLRNAYLLMVFTSFGITRSVIVNALRKFESAGVIESRSSGMKGTYIKVVNDFVFEELEAIKRKKDK